MLYFRQPIPIKTNQHLPEFAIEKSPKFFGLKKIRKHSSSSVLKAQLHSYWRSRLVPREPWVFWDLFAKIDFENPFQTDSQKNKKNIQKKQTNVI